jgi:aldose 1-epimerase
LFDEAAYPFDVTLTVNFALENSGLEITISATNSDAESAPIAFGLHPYFVSEAGSQLQVNAKTWIQKDSRNLPTQAVSIEKSAMVNMGLNSVEEMYVDDCFTDLVAEEDLFVTRLTRPETGFTVELHQSAQLGFLMFYTLREENQQKRTLIAIEPQTAPANAFKNLDQVTLLSPGNSFAANCKINLRKNQ